MVNDLTSLISIEEILNKKVSFQKKAYATTLEQEQYLRDVLTDIKGNKYKSEIERLRLYLEEGNEDMYGLYKKRLPGVTFCATFKDKRRRENIKTYNNLIVIDIDKLNLEELKRIKGILENDIYVLSYWESPSKKGIKGLVAIKYKESVSDYNINLCHKHSFKELVTYFQENYNLSLDESGSDITRLCFLSYDPEIRIKKEFKEFEINIGDIEENRSVETSKDKIKTFNENKLKETSQKNKLFNPSGKNDARNRKIMQLIIKYLTKRKISITDNYEKWFRVGYAISNTFTYDIGEKYFLKLCRLDGSQHNEIESKNLLLYCYEYSRGDISFSTIVFFAQKKGYVFKKRGESTEGANPEY